MTHPAPVRRALLSVSDKAGIVEFARALASRGVEILSTGGTHALLRDAGLPVTAVEDVTGMPEMLDGRVKTLHPAIHAGILALPDLPDHARALNAHGFRPIDLVCVSLYPFERTAANPDATRDEIIEQIDIGGPAMIRSAAKNAHRVLVVTHPSQYPAVLADLDAHAGASGDALRKTLARAAFERTARYDAAIAAYLAGEEDPGPLPPLIPALLVRDRGLRYGENPHQAAAVYAAPTVDLGAGVPQAEQLHGKELSYNNIQDASAAWSLAWRLGGQGVVACVVKHANPCGAARAGDARRAIDAAIAGDPLAAFGGIVALSGTLDEAAADRLCGADAFFEVVAAPGFHPAALDRLRARWANLRILRLPGGAAPGRVEFRSIPGGVLAQEPDDRVASSADLRHVAGPAPTPEQIRAATFLEPVARALSSNAVCIGGEADGVVALYGAGAGQMDRVAACRIAAGKAGDRARGAVAFSDAFFPFPDGPGVLIDAGIGAIVHPGGSKRDADTFALCDARGVTCILNGLRHFRH